MQVCIHYSSTGIIHSMLVLTKVACRCVCPYLGYQQKHSGASVQVNVPRIVLQAFFYQEVSLLKNDPPCCHKP